MLASGTAFFAPAGLSGIGATQRWLDVVQNCCAIGAGAQQCLTRRPVRTGVLSVSASGVPRTPPPPPRRDGLPPPPPNKAVGAGGANHQKVKDPQLQAGAWREELGLGLNRLSSSVTGSGAGVKQECTRLMLRSVDFFWPMLLDMLSATSDIIRCFRRLRWQRGKGNEMAESCREGIACIKHWQGDETKNPARKCTAATHAQHGAVGGSSRNW